MAEEWYPRVIVNTRHGGAYERSRNGTPGAWAAFPGYPEEVPENALGDDTECREWWDKPTVAVGVGMTPDAALVDLEEVVDGCSHPEALRHEVPAGFVCRYCNQLVKTRK
jgi:hypothetical protein